MTTRIKIENDANSNGDVVIDALGVHGDDLPFGRHELRLFPGESRTLWITTSSALFITETWPTEKPQPVAHPQDHAEDQTYESRPVVHAPHEAIRDAIRDEGPDFVPSSYRP